MLVDFEVRGRQGMGFFTGGSIIMNYGLVFWSEAMIETWPEDKYIFRKCSFLG